MKFDIKEIKQAGGSLFNLTITGSHDEIAACITQLKKRIKRD